MTPNPQPIPERAREIIARYLTDWINDKNRTVYMSVPNALDDNAGGIIAALDAAGLVIREKD
jgi:hypothetical protein